MGNRPLLVPPGFKARLEDLLKAVGGQLSLFDEQAHPRHGKGSEKGGQFAPKGGGGGGGQAAARPQAQARQARPSVAAPLKQGADSRTGSEQAAKGKQVAEGKKLVDYAVALAEAGALNNSPEEIWGRLDRIAKQQFDQWLEQGGGQLSAMPSGPKRFAAAVNRLLANKQADGGVDTRETRDNFMRNLRSMRRTYSAMASELDAHNAAMQEQIAALKPITKYDSEAEALADKEQGRLVMQLPNGEWYRFATGKGRAPSDYQMQQWAERWGVVESTIERRKRLREQIQTAESEGAAKGYDVFAEELAAESGSRSVNAELHDLQQDLRDTIAEMARMEEVKSSAWTPTEVARYKELDAEAKRLNEERAAAERAMMRRSMASQELPAEAPATLRRARPHVHEPSRNRAKLVPRGPCNSFGDAQHGL